jgi:uncharacterized delta-60 repeat protein
MKSFPNAWILTFFITRFLMADVSGQGDSPFTAAAIEGESLSWTTGGTTPWVAQTAVSHDASDAARSGSVSDDEESWLQTNVTGPGVLSFWWKVSSEEDYDHLEFYLNGIRQGGRISGETDWVQSTFTLPGGTHTLRWNYAKDFSDSSGSDMGWLDQVSWTPAAEYPPVFNGTSTSVGTVGQPYSYALSFAHSPVSYAAAGLPAGLVLDTATGVISGIPEAVGIHAIPLSATNGAGTGTASLDLTIEKGSQTISFSPLTNRFVGDAPFSLSATASSGLAVNFALVSGPASISGNTLTLTGESGTVTVSASQPGNANYHAAVPLNRSFAISAAPPAVPLPGSCDELDAYVAGGPVSAIAVQPDGKKLIGGHFTSVGGVPRAFIARLAADGSLDPGFDPKAGGPVSCIAVQADGKILLGGNFQTLQPNGAAAATSRKYIARLLSDGSLDTAFDPKAGGFGNTVQCLAVQADGKILLGGQFGTFQPNGAATTTNRLRIARLHPDGSLDTGFDPKANGPVECIATQADGKILLAGSFTTLQPNGAAAATSRQYVARLNADGSLDPLFDPKANLNVTSLAVQADGKVLIGGMFYSMQPNGASAPTTRIHLARVNADGSLDTGFNPTVRNIVAGLVNNGNDAGTILSIAPQVDGKILIGGQFHSFQANGAGPWISRSFIARILTDGTLDTTFLPGDPTYGTFDLVRGLALEADGRVLVGGDFTASPITRDFFERLHNNSATQSLAAPSSTQVLWQRGGTSPELAHVTFERSADGGATWVLLGSAVRVGSTAAWQLGGLALPASGLLRARGRTTGGEWNASSGLVESMVAYQIGSSPTAAPVLTSATSLTGTVGQNFSHTATYANTPTFFSARGLPPGLFMNGSTGVISGAPYAAGVYSAYMNASNNAGVSETTTLVITVREMPSAPGQYDFALFAGSSDTSGSADGLGTAARFSYPQGIAVDETGNIYVADSDNKIIRKITPQGLVTTLAGIAGLEGNADGTNFAARFRNPTDITLDDDGNIFVADSLNDIRKITSTGIVSTIDIGFVLAPESVSIDGSGNVYIVDSFFGCIFKVTPSGIRTTFAGSDTGLGSTGSADGIGNQARFNRPRGAAIDTNHNLYIADAESHTIRKVTINGAVSTLAGSAGVSGKNDGMTTTARFNLPIAVAVDESGNVYVADVLNDSIRKITADGLVTTLTQIINGNGSISRPRAVAVDVSGNLYVASGDAIYKGTPSAADPPVRIITPTPRGTVGQNYSYPCEFTGNPTSYNASNLPPGLSIDPATGVISGTLTTPSVASEYEHLAIGYIVFVYATNSAGTGTGQVKIMIDPEPIAPVFTSATTATGTVGQSLSFNVHFDGAYSLRPYVVNGLPAGLAYDRVTELITGVPTTAGIYPVSLSAQNRNRTATGYGMVTLTILPGSGPPADPFASFMAGSNTPESQRGGLDDPDKDGVANLFEYLFGGNPMLSSNALLPVITKEPGSGNTIFTYQRKIAATGVMQVIEHAADLSSAWSPAVHGQNGVVISNASIPGDATSERVTISIPASGGRRFVRLKAIR